MRIFKKRMTVKGLSRVHEEIECLEIERDEMTLLYRKFNPEYRKSLWYNDKYKTSYPGSYSFTERSESVEYRLEVECILDGLSITAENTIMGRIEGIERRLTELKNIKL